MLLTLTDSCLNGIKGDEKENGYCTYHLEAIDKLNTQIKNKDRSLQIISLAKKNRSNHDFDKFLWYEIKGTCKHGGAYYYKFNHVDFYTSHYVGYYSTIIDNNRVSITIEPRFGSDVQNHLFSHALDLYMPKGESQQASDKQSNLWLIALMWRVNLEKALTKSQIPKIYQRTEKNQRFFRCRLKVNEHIRNNFSDESRFYCVYSKFTFDSPINRAIRYTYRLLIKEGYKEIVKGIAEHDQMLADFGVSNKPITIQDIDNIRYSPMNISYRPLMQICRSIVSYKSYKNSPNTGATNNFAVFLDMSEVWENYLYKLLLKNLDDYDVISPNLVGGDYLFEGEMRQVRPDILIEKNGKVVAIIDAKYKWYEKIGEYAAKKSVSREDLYQMATYLHRFGHDDTIGIFVPPCSTEKEGLLKVKNTNHKMGVLGLDIDIKDIDIKEQEGSFVNSVKNYLLPRIPI